MQRVLIAGATNISASRRAARHPIADEILRRGIDGHARPGLRRHDAFHGLLFKRVAQPDMQRTELIEP